MCKSTDGGRTWSSYKRPEEEQGQMSLWQILSDGSFISVRGDAFGVRSDPLPVRVSKDEGRTWQQISGIKLPPQYNERYAYHMFRLPDDTLLCGFICRDQLSAPGCRAMVSHDEGNTWEDEVYYLDHPQGTEATKPAWCGKTT